MKRCLSWRDQGTRIYLVKMETRASQARNEAMWEVHLGRKSETQWPGIEAKLRLCLNVGQSLIE